MSINIPKGALGMLGNTMKSIDFTGKALDGSWLKNEAISNNIANVNTPNFKRDVVDFESVLEDFLQNSKANISSKINTMDFQKVKDTSTSFRLDGNNVDLDQEMAELAKNQLYYTSIITQLNSKISRMKSAIRDGR